MRNKFKKLNSDDRGAAWHWLQLHFIYLSKNNTKPHGYQYDSSIAKCRIINSVLDQNRWVRSIRGYMGQKVRDNLYPHQLWRVSQWAQGTEHHWDWDNLPFPKKVIAYCRKNYGATQEPAFLTEKILKKYKPKRKVFKLRR